MYSFNLFASFCKFLARIHFSRSRIVPRQHLFMVPIVATVDFDADDAHLVDPDHRKKSKWLLRNAVVVKLEEGDTFYVPGEEPVRPDSDTLCARNVRRRQEAARGL